MCLPVKGGLRQAVHPRLQLQTRVFSERWHDEREDQRQTHKNSRQDHLGGWWQIWNQIISLKRPWRGSAWDIYPTTSEGKMLQKCYKCVRLEWNRGYFSNCQMSWSWLFLQNSLNRKKQNQIWGIPSTARVTTITGGPEVIQNSNSFIVIVIEHTITIVSRNRLWSFYDHLNYTILVKTSLGFLENKTTHKRSSIISCSVHWRSVRVIPCVSMTAQDSKSDPFHHPPHRAASLLLRAAKCLMQSSQWRVPH